MQLLLLIAGCEMWLFPFIEKWSSCFSNRHKADNNRYGLLNSHHTVYVHILQIISIDIHKIHIHVHHSNLSYKIIDDVFRLQNQKQCTKAAALALFNLKLGRAINILGSHARQPGTTLSTHRISNVINCYVICWAEFIDIWYPFIL